MTRIYTSRVTGIFMPYFVLHAFTVPKSALGEPLEPR